MASVADSADAPASDLEPRDGALVDDSDLDPAAFLKSVRELSEKREREDLERFRKLEEEVRKGREERAARRAERARSISPEKHDSTVSSPTSRTLSRATTHTKLLNSSPGTISPPSSAAEFRDTTTRQPAVMDPEKTLAKDADIPDFKGFGNLKRSSTVSSRASQTLASSEDSDSRPQPSASYLARSGTLSWQQRPRPGSKLGGSRPQSMIATDPSHMRETSTDEPEPSRDQIAASLGARDPTWFRQTADRGIGNAAYRKSKDESTQGETVFSERRGLPGMSRESSLGRESHGSPPMSNGFKSEQVSRGGSVQESTLSNPGRYSATSTSSSNKPDLKSLIEADEEQQRASPSYDQESAASTKSSGGHRTFNMSSAQARSANTMERPESPTKGMGGFVQSAMMKRTDSQNKRWSAQPGGSLNRANSIASARDGVGGLQGSYSMPKLEPAISSREASNEPASRPTSSSNNDLVSLNIESHQSRIGFVKPVLPHHSRSKSVASNYSANEDSGVPQPPGSPSKRWSPSKSSWLESSLTRPESPKPAPSKNSQPSWMADIAKAKAQRAATDSMHGTASGFDREDTSKPPARPGSPTRAVTRPGQNTLKRSDAMDSLENPNTITPTTNVRTLRIADKFDVSPAAVPSPKVTSMSPTRKTTNVPIELDSTKEAPIRDVPEASALSNTPVLPSMTTEDPPQIDLVPTKKPEVNISPRPSSVQSAATSEKTAVKPNRSDTFESPSFDTNSSQPLVPPKPPTDFRSVLKSRPTTTAKPQDEPEFLSKFGNLRKTQQEKYVAPDVLKSNILRGKSGLAVTGGPVKTPIRDELKESLLAKKDDIKKAKEEGRDLPGQAHERKTSRELPQAPSKPEALAKRELLGRSDSAKSVVPTDKIREATPEALARHKSLHQKGAPTGTRKETEDLMPNVSKPEPLNKMTSTATAVGPNFDTLSKQTSEPIDLPVKQPSGTSELAARFNPQLANILARGPPSNTPSRLETSAATGLTASTPKNDSDEPPAASVPLQDMRKDRAKGPKRRKGAAKPTVEYLTEPPPGSADVSEPTPVNAQTSDVKNKPTEATKVPMGPKFAATRSESGRSNSVKEDLAGLRSMIPQIEPEKSAPAPGLKPSLLSGYIAPNPNTALNKSLQQASVGPHGAEQGNPASPFLKSKPQAIPGSAASTMRASLSENPQPNKGVEEEHHPSTPTNPVLTARSIVDLQKSSTPARNTSVVKPEKIAPDSDAGTAAVPEFKGFGAARPQRSPQSSEDDKENATDSDSPSKSAASQWQRRPSPTKNDVPSQIQLPTKKDEEAAMRSAGLLASTLPKKNSDLGMAVERTSDKPLPIPPASTSLPMKPAKSSRAVSGQLVETSSNKGFLSSAANVGLPKTEAARLLVNAFKTIPKYREPLAIDTSAVILLASQEERSQTQKTLRRTVQIVDADGSTKPLPPHEAYTFFDESVYICTHVYINVNGARSSQLFLWCGGKGSESAVETANNIARQVSRDNGSAHIHAIRQGLETSDFLEALGGIFATRRGCRKSAPKQYMLCGRKHLGHIVFDEVDFGLEWMNSGFVYLVSYPVTLQETKLYLWKGSECNPEEISAARLAAMDLGETGEIIEVDGGIEIPSFLKIFGPNTTKWSITKPTATWHGRAASFRKSKSRLYRIQTAEVKTGLLTSLWNRRPSWNGISPARSPAREWDEIKVEVKEIASITQSQLDADGIYLFDAFAEVYLLIGPLLGSHPEKVWSTLLGQALLFASDYAIMASSMEDRPNIPNCLVLFASVPKDLKLLFRHWNDSWGLWGTAGLMAGSSFSIGRESQPIPLTEMLTEVCRD